MKKYTKGFTLIELLVVIAIIGILSSVVLVSLNSARDKAKDSRVTSAVAQVRSLAEQLYDGAVYNATSFVTPAATDTCTQVANSDNNLYALDTDIRAQNGVLDCLPNVAGQLIIQKQTGTGANTAYRAIAKLPSKTVAATGGAGVNIGVGLWCVDSSGISEEIGTAVAGGIPTAEAANTAPTCANAID